MFKKLKLIIFGSVTALGLVGLLLVIQSLPYAVLDPKGAIAADQKQLLIDATLLMLVVVVPVFILTAFIAWTYRESNTKARYMPDWDSNKRLEAAWWGIPFVLIVFLSVIIWDSSHKLDPYRPLNSPVAPLEVQVIALQYKWLFIYPEQNIATVNYLKLPTNRPVNFSITADAPMNSFWIPQLGGQVYAMAGMTTKLHLVAEHAGSYRGSSANISGEGFADMHFTTDAVDPDRFASWAASVRSIEDDLSADEYSKLARPGVSDVPLFYNSAAPNLYQSVIDKYMAHHGSNNHDGGH